MMRLGTCLCGKSTIKIPIECISLGICHCSMCRKLCSGPWMGIQSPKEKTVFSGDSIKTYKSSKHAVRKFCSDCGSTLSHEPTKAPYFVISAGIFDKPSNDEESFKVTHEIFTDEKPEWYEINAASDRKQLTGMQAIMHYVPKMVFHDIKTKFNKLVQRSK